MSTNLPSDEAPVRIELALVSHTNNGKTTLARTLLGLDVGEVRDAAHVTERSEAHQLLASDAGDTLQLWDTPGFGDSVRLAKRLAMSGNPIGWFLSEVLDRWRDRPFWLSQQALRAARDAADVVLYLVNAAEDPQDTGYLAPEMQILQWLGKPVIVLLNQTGSPRDADAARREEARWTQHLAGHPIVREVLTLDAFTRCWVHERVFHDAVGRVVPASKQAGHRRLLQAWEAANTRRFTDAMAVMAQQLALATRDVETVTRKTTASRVKSLLRKVGLAGTPQATEDHGSQQAMDRLLGRLQGSIAQSTTQLLALHQIAPGAAAEINARVRENFALKAPLDRAQAGLLGAVLAGGLTGLKADALSGGMTMGAGALVGGVVGALSFASAAWGFNELDGRQTPTVRFSDAFLRSLAASSVLRYLTIAHFGRGRGSFEEDPAPAFWRAAVDAAMERHAGALDAVWAALREPTTEAHARQQLQAALHTITWGALQTLYPQQVGPPVRTPL